MNFLDYYESLYPTKPYTPRVYVPEPEPVKLKAKEPKYKLVDAATYRTTILCSRGGISFPANLECTNCHYPRGLHHSGKCQDNSGNMFEPILLGD